MQKKVSRRKTIRYFSCNVIGGVLYFLLEDFWISVLLDESVSVCVSVELGVWAVTMAVGTNGIVPIMIGWIVPKLLFPQHPSTAAEIFNEIVPLKKTSCQYKL